MAKVNVMAPEACPLYTFLTKKIPPPPLCDWNFTKILVAPGGRVFKRYMSKIPPFDLENEIKAQLGV